MKVEQKPFFLTGNFAPLTSEGKSNHLKVIKGHVPKQLNGCLYRNGPNPQFPNPNHHWFQGDGMIHAIRLQQGEASYQNCWIHTERFIAEQQANRSLFGGWGDPQGNDPLVEGINGSTANTHIISHGGHLLALQETSCPTELNPNNLQTLGRYDFDGQVPAMSAHPHTIHQSGDLFCHDYKPFSNEVLYYRINANSEVVNQETITIPYSSFMHDFMISQHYMILPVMPLSFDMQRAQQGGPAMAWDASKASHFAIMPHGGSQADLIWFELPGFYVYHFMNAYEEKDCVMVDGMKSRQPSLFPDCQGGTASREDAATYLTRWRFNLTTRQVEEIQLDNTCAEFPRLDERFVGLPYRHGFGAGVVDGHADEEFLDAILHYDLQTQKTTVRRFGKQTPCEPVFVPKNKNSVEGDGYLLTVIYNVDSNNSELWILDALHIEDEPIAIVEMPQRIPFGFHGSWSSSE